MVNLINALCYRAHPPVIAAEPPRTQPRAFARTARVFEPPSPPPRLTETQTPAGPRFMGTREKSGLVFQGEVRHECTKQALARLRPGGAGDPGRGYRRSRVARAEHLAPLARRHHIVRRRPRASGDPYSRRRWSWVPAFAGTTVFNLKGLLQLTNHKSGDCRHDRVVERTWAIHCQCIRPGIDASKAA